MLDIYVQPPAPVDDIGEQVAERRISFPQELVDRALAEARDADIIKDELVVMEESSMAVADLQYRAYKQRTSDSGEWEGTARAVGLALAHRVLRYGAAAVGRTLPPVGDEQARNYEAYARKVPAVLEADFLRDYAGHAAVTGLVTGIKTNQSRESAMLMFNLHGRLANPDRGPVLIPQREGSLMGRPTPPRRRPQGGLNGQLQKRRH
jgi:hypothetical protein